MLLLDISSWWSTQETIEQIYWIFAFPSSLFFLIIMAMTFIGGEIDDAGAADVDVDSDHGVGFQFFTMKNLVGFFTVFAWSGLACLDSGLGNTATIVISIAAGLSMMLIMASIFFFMGRLSDSGTLNLHNAIKGIGEVYLPLGGKRSNFGKVQINIQGSLRTLQAMTDDDDDLPVGTIVEVIDIVNDQILLVTKSTN